MPGVADVVEGGAPAQATSSRDAHNSRKMRIIGKTPDGGNRGAVEWTGRAQTRQYTGPGCCRTERSPMSWLLILLELGVALILVLIVLWALRPRANRDAPAQPDPTIPHSPTPHSDSQDR